MRKNYLLGDHIQLQGDTTWFDDWVESITGERPKWEPYQVPLIPMKDIKPHILDPEECKKHKFTWAIPTTKTE